MTSVADTIRISKIEDLQKIPLTTFTRPDKTTYKAYNLERANLEGANLTGANLEGANLKRANLTGANLERAELERAELERANLKRANLTGANLRDAYLEGANLRGANLRDANLRDAYLEGANLRDANLTGANLTGANLEGANLTGANLEGANLRDANLGDANLGDADLRADLEGANLINANLEGAALGDEGNLKRADLRGANLRDAYLAFVDFQGADLRDANLVDTELANANLINANLINADLINANLAGANLTGANLTGANLERAILRGANLTDVTGLNVPRLLQPAPTAPTAPVLGVAYEVHIKSDELGSNAKFLTTIGFYKSPRLNSFNYDKVQTKFVNFINDETNFKNSDKGKLVENLKKVLNKAKICGIPIGDKANLLNKAIEFAFQQDSRFTEAYIDIFIDETSKAYSSGTDNMSCVAGIKERFYTSLLGAALQMDTIEGFTKTPEVRTLFCMAKTGKVQKNPNEILQKWAESWEGKVDEWKEIGLNGRKEHLKTYMMEEYKKDECYEENKESIENIINEKVNELDYVFKNSENAAQFGGRKRKTKRSLEKVGKSMKNKTKTKTKRNTRKAKQNKKKRITRKAKQNKK
jgi:uncharacterized protein YjbI with pentapeptide repeats